MKRRIFTFLLAAALVLLTACSGRGTEPPVRIGEAIGEASLLRSYSAAEAFQEADAVALVRVGDWLGEQDGGFPITFYKAAVVKSYKGDLPREFTLMQNGGSAGTYEDYPLYTCGNELLVFLRKADADYPDAYQSVGSFSTVLYAADAVDGHPVLSGPVRPDEHAGAGDRGFRLGAAVVPDAGGHRGGAAGRPGKDGRPAGGESFLRGAEE